MVHHPKRQRVVRPYNYLCLERINQELWRQRALFFWERGYFVGAVNESGGTREYGNECEFLSGRS